MKQSNWIQLGILIIGMIALFFTLIFKLWDKNVEGLIITLYGLVYILFVLIGFLFYKMYENG